MKQTDTNIFYLPLSYLHQVRLERQLGRIASWWFLMVVPTLGYYLMAITTPNLPAIGLYLLLIVAVVSYYELGYMLNDTYTTRHETNPTLRLTEQQSTYFYQHIGRILGWRMLWVLGTLGIYGLLTDWNRNSLLTIAGILLLLPLFFLYNTFRGWKSVVFYPVLVGWRYLVFLLPAWGTESFWMCVLLLLFTYPVLIGIERYSMPGKRYGLVAQLIPNEPSKQRFRAWYYVVVLLLLLSIWWEHPWWCVPMLGVGIYRWIRVVMK